MPILAGVMLVLGTALMLVAAIGLIRLGDPLQRMHSATKAGTLGTTLLIGGVLAGMDDPPLSSGILTIVFITVTLPIASQMLGRATFLSDARLAEGSALDIAELEHLRNRALPDNADGMQD